MKGKNIYRRFDEQSDTMNFDLLLEGYPEMVKLILLQTRKARDFCNFLLTSERVYSLFRKEEVQEHIRQVLGLELRKECNEYNCDDPSENVIDDKLYFPGDKQVKKYHVRKGTKIKHGKCVEISHTFDEFEKTTIFYRNNIPYYEKVCDNKGPLFEMDKRTKIKKKWDDTDQRFLVLCVSPTEKKMWSREDGRLLYTLNKVTGEVREWDQQGKKILKGFVRDGKKPYSNFTGKYWSYGRFSFGDQSRKETRKHYQEDGETVKQIDYVYEKGKRHIIRKKVKEGLFMRVKKYRLYGTLKKEFFEDKQSIMKEGRFVSYYSNGQVKREEHYNNDRRKGLCVTYHPNGNKKEVVVNLGTIFVGKRTTFTAEGKLKLTERYNKKGILQGKRKKWDHNGKLKWKRVYCDGKVAY